MPQISIIMPVFNTAVSILHEAVVSIMNQTFQDFEFIIVDDGSSGECAEYLVGLQDPRIRVIKNVKNVGISKSLNIGLRIARGKYIARMDSDDISFPNRLEKQYAYMEAHPNTIVCGTSVEVFGEKTGIWELGNCDMKYYRVKMLFLNPGPVHPTAFFNRNLLLKNHLSYNESIHYAEDYYMWMEIVNFGDIVILDDVLLRFRVHQDKVSVIHRKEQIESDQIIQKELLTQLLGNVTEEEVKAHYYHSTGYYREATISPWINEWYDRLIAANKKKGIYDQKRLMQRIVEVKKKLIYQTFTLDMTKLQKASLLFRYLPFNDALRELTIRIIVATGKKYCIINNK